jgi:hypothetical protein
MYLKKENQKIRILQEAFDRHNIAPINKGRSRDIPLQEQA